MGAQDNLSPRQFVGRPLYHLTSKDNAKSILTAQPG